MIKHRWVVCIKQVPREPVFKREGDYFKVDRDRTEGILNPCDRDALNTACELKEKAGGEIVALSMGPPQADEVLREALACGADRAVLLSDPAFAGADTLATARTLAAAVRKLGNYSLVLCGSRTLDSDTGQVGAQLAELLDIPMASRVDRIACRAACLRVDRRMDGMRERLEIPFPALITVDRPQKKAGAASLRALEVAFGDVPVDRWSRKDLHLSPSQVGWEGSATWARDFAYWKKKRAGEKLEGDAGEAADRILSALLERNIFDGS
jgi:electron transfer flavoprotein alpha/beta subunit